MGILALRANQRVGQVLQEYAADAALGGVAEYKAAVQGFVLDAREDFAAHSVLDVQARFGGCLTDIVRQRDEFCRIDGVDNAQLVSSE